MFTLAADTSLPLLSVALLSDSTLLGSIALEGKGSRNEKLLPAIDWVLTECNVDRKSIDLFAVTRGPGSFTGVRIGLATMQGLALALDRPLIAMSTHEAIARGSVTIADDAGRGEFYVSVFENGREIVAPHLEKTIDGAALRVGDFVQSHNVAVECARRAMEIVRDGAADRYAYITPIYVRLAEAEVKLQQKNG